MTTRKLVYIVMAVAVLILMLAIFFTLVGHGSGGFEKSGYAHTVVH